MFTSNLVLSRIQGVLNDVQFCFGGVTTFPAHTATYFTVEGAVCLTTCFVHKAYGSEVNNSILRSELLNQKALGVRLIKTLQSKLIWQRYREVLEEYLQRNFQITLKKCWLEHRRLLSGNLFSCTKLGRQYTRRGYEKVDFEEAKVGSVVEGTLQNVEKPLQALQHTSKPAWKCHRHSSTLLLTTQQWE